MSAPSLGFLHWSQVLGLSSSTSAATKTIRAPAGLNPAIPAWPQSAFGPVRVFRQSVYEELAARPRAKTVKPNRPTTVPRRERPLALTLLSCLRAPATSRGKTAHPSGALESWAHSLLHVMCTSRNETSKTLLILVSSCMCCGA